ncbi:MAG: alpha/beta hydrolase, partial [Nonomuraea sp.]|nr:alpha/beta hydrolase [Nonomuraea sp.]
DGTVIDHDRRGSGPPVALVGDREENAPLAAALAGHVTVRTYDQRGRGASGDTPPYAVEREIEDLRAIIELAADVCVYGVSSGGALALEAADLVDGHCHQAGVVLRVGAADVGQQAVQPGVQVAARQRRGRRQRQVQALVDVAGAPLHQPVGEEQQQVAVAQFDAGQVVGLLAGRPQDDPARRRELP